MRLSSEDAQRITECIHRHLGDRARVWLFGSRVDDGTRGGDVDLYVETQPRALMQEVRCKLELEGALDVPVDLIVRHADDSSPIAVIARTEGIEL